jgi:transposase
MKRPSNPITRFFPKVNFDGAKIVESPCWEWMAGRNDDGYGQFWINDRLIRSHHFVFELVHGKIQKDKIILHRCDNPPCCNPDHLSQGTDYDNAKDRVTRGRENADKSKRFSNEIADQARKDVASGMRRMDVAAKYGMCSKTLRNMINMKRQRDALSPEELKERLKLRKKVSPAVQAQIRDLYAQDVFITHIATRLDVSASTVRKYANGSRT